MRTLKDFMSPKGLINIISKNHKCFSIGNEQLDVFVYESNNFYFLEFIGNGKEWYINTIVKVSKQLTNEQLFEVALHMNTYFEINLVDPTDYIVK